jgi:hypothetical protein
MAATPIPEIPCSENVTLDSYYPDAPPPSAATLRGSYLGLPATYTANVDASLTVTGKGTPTAIFSRGITTGYSVALTMRPSEMDNLVVSGSPPTPPQFRIDWVKKESGAQAGSLLKVRFTRI